MHNEGAGGRVNSPSSPTRTKGVSYPNRETPYFLLKPASHTAPSAYLRDTSSIVLTMSALGDAQDEFADAFDTNDLKGDARC